nr:ephrin type-B receptor [Ipomoea batatas]
MFAGCEIAINVIGNFKLDENSTILAGTSQLVANNAIFSIGSAVNTTGLAGSPSEQTSGTPQSLDGGGGYGGRGVVCLTNIKKLHEDVWGGDAYGWSTMQVPFGVGMRTEVKAEQIAGM